MRSRCRCSMCSAIHISSRSWLRSSSTHEPSDPPLKVVSKVSNRCASPGASCNIGQKSAPVRKRAKLIGKGKSEDDGRAVGNRTRANSLNLAARKDRELPPSPSKKGTDVGTQDQSQEPQDLTVKKMGRSSAPAGWRERLFEPYDPANPPPRLPRAEPEDY